MDVLYRSSKNRHKEKTNLDKATRKKVGKLMLMLMLMLLLLLMMMMMTTTFISKHAPARKPTDLYITSF
jgi:flagellar basal body-associated protein FliL